MKSFHSPLSNTQPYLDAADPSEKRPVERKSSFRHILWIDGVGGYLMIDRDDVLIGQATAGNPVDIGIVGDLSRQAAVLRRRGADYFIEPLQETRLSGTVIQNPQLLGPGAEVQWGTRVRVRIVRPHPLSSSARLDIISLHRFQPRVDGVLLLADSCILGPSSSSHVPCPLWQEDLLMYRHEGQWYFRTTREVEVNGQVCQGQIPLRAGLRMIGSDFSLAIE